jgi:hypothetical protein
MPLYTAATTPVMHRLVGELKTLSMRSLSLIRLANAKLLKYILHSYSSALCKHPKQPHSDIFDFIVFVEELDVALDASCGVDVAINSQLAEDTTTTVQGS